jgi:predicted RNA-binding Zn-ribbon protein involved in translation (DUF1610 family)
MIHGVPNYKDYIRDKGGPVGRCLACGFQGAMANGATGYECPVCHAMRLEFSLRDGRVYRQFQPKLGSIELLAGRRVPLTRSDSGVVDAFA